MIRHHWYLLRHDREYRRALVGIITNAVIAVAMLGWMLSGWYPEKN